MVVVRTATTSISFAVATRVSTDEHNNLQIFDDERLMQIFAAGVWCEVEISYDRDN